MEKTGIRSAIRQARRVERHRLGDRGWRNRGDHLALTVTDHRQVRQVCQLGGVITSYASFGNEPPTDALNSTLLNRGARVLLPVTARDGDVFPKLAWVDASDPDGPVVGVGPVGLAALGCQVMLIPALAVTPDGQRLGQGGGYYDQLLVDVARFEDGGPLRIAIVGAAEVLETVPSDPHDQPMDLFVTG